MATPKEETEVLLNAVMPFAEQMLRNHGSFHPFGAAMKPTGEVVQVGATSGSEQPPAQELIDILKDGFRAGARAGSYKATALAFDVRIVLPGERDKRDAVQVNLDHIEKYSVEIFFPYRSHGKEVVIESPFAQRGDSAVFGDHNGEA